MDNDLTNAKWIAEHAVLDPHHANVKEINYGIVERLPWIAWDFKKANASASDEAVLNIHTESVTYLLPTSICLGCQNII
eukprot:6214139-Pleurochrysis_carterae.AAC.1